MKKSPKKCKLYESYVENELKISEIKQELDDVDKKKNTLKEMLNTHTNRTDNIKKKMFIHVKTCKKSSEQCKLLSDK